MLLKGFHFEEMGFSVKLHTSAVATAACVVNSWTLQVLMFPCPSTFPCPFPFPLLASTLEMRFLPTLVTFSILGRAVFFGYDGVAPQQLKDLYLLWLGRLNVCPLLLVTFCCALLSQHVVHS